MDVVPTIRIKSDIPGCENGLDINESDFDPKVHVEFDAKPTKGKAAKAEPLDEGEADNGPAKSAAK